MIMEWYRSGHNGPDSKSGRRQRLVGSNPTHSALVGETLDISKGFSIFLVDI